MLKTTVLAETDLLYEIEEHLISLPIPTYTEKEFTIVVSVGELGVWFLKFRRTGNIYNRKDVVLASSIKSDGLLQFKTITSFHQVLVGTSTLENELLTGNVVIQASEDITNLVKLKFKKCAKQGEFLALSSSSNNNNLPIRSNRLPSNSGDQPIKSGWLLKKRDIISGWKCRYFEVFKGKLLYYSKETDTVPRGTISLENAEIGPVRSFKIKKVNEYWGFIVDADRKLRLVSERTGLEGQSEADSWNTAFREAIRSLDQKEKVSIKSPKLNDKSLKVRPTVKFEEEPKSPISPAAKAVALLKKMSMASFRFGRKRCKDEKLASQLIPMVICALIICLLSGFLHYAWAVKKIISTKLYLTLGLLITILVIIFFQEFVYTEEGETTEKAPNQIPKQNSSDDLSSFKTFLNTKPPANILSDDDDDGDDIIVEDGEEFDTN